MPTKQIVRRTLIRGAAAGVACACARLVPASAQDGPGPYVCPPCGCSADGTQFDGPGACPACGMALVPLASSRSAEVEFRSAGVVLSGTLVFPQQGPPIAAAVLIHGSGPEERMMGWAGRLAEDGLAVFTYDKRGVGRSGGVYEHERNVSAANLELLAEDAAAALDMIADRLQSPGVPIGFVGASQAGWIAPIAATRATAADFIVLVSSPVSTVAEELHFDRWAAQTPDFHRRNTSRDVADYLRTVTYHADDVDPAQSLSRLSIPGLWLFGSHDSSIPVALSTLRLEELIQRGHAYEYRVFEGYGHNFEASPDDHRYARLVAWIANLSARQ